MLHTSFYRFCSVQDPQALAQWVRELAREHGLLGAVVVAHEGLSGALAGAPAQLLAFEKALGDPAVLQGQLQGLHFKRSPCTHTPFARLKVHVKPEIVALGLPAVAETAATMSSAVPGQGLLSPTDWRDMLQDGNAVVLDNRNHFEYRLGHFKQALDPGVHNFRDFVRYVEQHAPTWLAQDRPVAMYCTGGIRCEKTAPWMRSLGLEVLQLEGGVLNYFAQMPDADRDWQGPCYVFDQRLAINTELLETGIVAEAVFDPALPDEAWRLQRARRLQAAAATTAKAATPAEAD